MKTEPSTQDLARLKRQVNVLHRVDRFMATLPDLNQLLEEILKESQAITDAQASSLALVDEKTQDLFFEIALGEKADAAKEIRIKKGEGIAGQVALSGSSKRIDDVCREKSFASRVDQKTGFKTKSILAVPLLRHGRPMGVIEVLNKKNNRPFSSEDQEILEILAHQAAIAIENARLIQENIAKERLASLGQGIAGAAHCIKNIINLVKVSSTAIDFAIQKESLDLVKHSWPAIHKGCDQITEMVMDMLTYAKPRTPAYGQTDLNQLLLDIIKMVSSRLEEKTIRVSHDLDPGIGPVVIGRQEIQRCILNLFSNAADALDTGGRISLKTEPMINSEAVQIVFTDNGPGIPDDRLGRIFDVFFSSKGSNGTGLGLSITKKIIDEHGGDISVQSIVGKGTTFTIRLPVNGKQTLVSG